MDEAGLRIVREKKVTGFAGGKTRSVSLKQHSHMRAASEESGVRGVHSSGGGV